MNPLIKQSGLVAVVFASLVACSKSEPLAPELQAAVETRQQGFSDIGEAFKTIRDALQAGRSLDADMAAAAHLSVVDYLGEIPWESYPSAKSWYARMKSRPSFRALLADRMPGITPAPVYADLDF